LFPLPPGLRLIGRKGRGFAVEAVRVSTINDEIAKKCHTPSHRINQLSI
jgi:hypothetical protein